MSNEHNQKGFFELSYLIISYYNAIKTHITPQNDNCASIVHEHNAYGNSLRFSRIRFVTGFSERIFEVSAYIQRNNLTQVFEHQVFLMFPH